MIQVNIVSYKYGHLVANAIESVLAQTWPADRILVVDDGVGDCSHVKSLYPMVELLERQKNLGIVDNFNDILMNQTTHEKVMFLGADNYLRPDALEKMNDANADVVSSDIAVFGSEVDYFRESRGITEHKDGYWIWRFERGDINLANYIHGSSLYKTALGQKYGYRSSGGPNTEEDWMLFRELINNSASHAHVSEPLLYYRRHFHNFNQV